MRALLPLSLLVACTGKDVPESEAPAATAPWPAWTLRHWVWEDESTQESALGLVDGYLERDIEVGAIIIDSPWATGYNTFQFDPALFPDPQGLIDELHARDVRVFLWVVPAINTDQEELYAYAAERGWFMQDDADSGPEVVDWWKGDGSLIDYFNPEAVAWWHGLIQPVLDMGIDGWKCDGLDFSALLAPYSPGAGREVTRPEYSEVYYRDFFEHTRAVLGDDRIITARPVDNYGTGFGGEAAAFAPVDINWAGWVGDQDADFGGLAAALNNLYHSAAMGYVNSGADIGGYREDGSELGRDKEVFIRWAQAGAFWPVMENGGGGEHRPWAFDAETETIYRQLVQLHHALLPVLDAQGAVAFAEGRSLMTFQDERRYAWLLGDDVFVAPILQPGGGVEVTLPEGRWRYLYDSGAVLDGGAQLSLTLPLDEAAVYVRDGSEAADLLLAVVGG